MEMVGDWVVELGVTCVACPDCAFMFDAVHTDDGTDEYACPLCAESRLEAALAEANAEIARLTAAIRRAVDLANHPAIEDVLVGALNTTPSPQPGGE